MTYNDAVKRAREESKKGYVQHVNLTCNTNNDPQYHVSDWYDCDTTVKSFENGKEK